MHRWLRSWVLLCASLAVLTVASNARANAPWCDEMAQSIEAPLPVFPADDSTIDNWSPCEQSNQGLTHGSRPDRSYERSMVQFDNDKASQLVLAGARGPRGPLQAIAPRAESPQLPWIGSSLDRPPQR
jgi:hypothetical protein